jgi:hypothetical protein
MMLFYLIQDYLWSKFMTTKIQAIEKTIQQLPTHDLAEFRRWFIQFDEAAWDVQIEADTGAGKLDALAAEALAEYHTGKARQL